MSPHSSWDDLNSRGGYRQYIYTHCTCDISFNMWCVVCGCAIFLQCVQYKRSHYVYWLIFHTTTTKHQWKTDCQRRKRLFLYTATACSQIFTVGTFSGFNVQISRIWEKDHSLTLMQDRPMCNSFSCQGNRWGIVVGSNKTEKGPIHVHSHKHEGTYSPRVTDCTVKSWKERWWDPKSNGGGEGEMSFKTQLWQPGSGTDNLTSDGLTCSTVPLRSPQPSFNPGSHLVSHISRGIKHTSFRSSFLFTVGWGNFKVDSLSDW